MTIKYILPLLLFAFSQPVFSADYPMQEYEMVVVESLPENLNLSMTLSEITEAKRGSRIGETKKKIREVVTGRLLKLLQTKSTDTDFNLLTLAQSIPVTEVLNDIMAAEKELNPNNNLPAADFTVVIMPKLPKSLEVGGRIVPYAPLYSGNKASVISTPGQSFQPQLSYSDAINLRVQRAIQLSYQRNYIELASNDAFFVGSLLNIHLDGDKSSIKTQILGGLPTNVDQEFLESQPQVDIRLFRSPRTPSLNKLSDNEFPGAVITLLHTPYAKQKGNLNIQFGSLSKIKGTNWELTDAPKDFKDQIGYGDYGIAGFTKSHNIPHLLGDPKELAEGQDRINGFFQKRYNMKMNIHAVNINLDKIEISDMRVTIDIVQKEGFSFLNSFAFSLPTLEMPDAVSKKFKEAGNEQINAQKQKIEPLLSNADVLLKNEAAQEKLIGVITNLLQNKKGGQL